LDGRLHSVRRHLENFFLEYFWDGRRFAPASFSILLELSGMAVALLRHPGGMKTLHFVTIFSNLDGRLHFVRRHLEKSFFNIFGMAVALLRHP
jgi:hypothetical protein